MNDRTGAAPIKVFAHVRITNPRHRHCGQTGTVVRIDHDNRRVWVSLPGGDVTPARNLSIEVVVPRASSLVKLK